MEPADRPVHRGLRGRPVYLSLCPWRVATEARSGHREEAIRTTRSQNNDLASHIDTIIMI